ncbi:MAG: diguanylate cyclase [Rhizobacter sp.]|nr:diguanylate cyclase [Rhizobacter sp.]
MPHRPLPRLIVWAAVPLCYYAGAKLGVWAAAMPEGIAILWPPNAVLLTAMLLSRGRDLVSIALLGIAAEVAADLPTFTLAEALSFGVANALEATVASQLLKRWRFDPRLATLADLRKFLLAGPIVAAPMAAALGAAVYAHFRGGSTSYLEFMRVWWMGDAMGLLIFTPLLLTLAAGRLADSRPVVVKRLRAVDVAVLALGAAIVSSVLVPQLLHRVGLSVTPVLVIPCLVYVATRFDVRVVSGCVATIALALAYATSHGLQPFGRLTGHEASLRAQEFIFTMSLLALGLVALLQQLRARQAELREANARLDQLNRSLEARVAERTAQLDETNRQLEHLAMTDTLTGLSNRRAFFAAAHSVVNSAVRHRRPLALVMIDIDHFKLINDTHGHAAGDAVLQHVAAALRGVVRQADVLARYGGEEFVLVAPETDLDNAVALAARMRAALLAEPVPFDGGRIAVTASFGVSALAADGDDLSRLTRRADAALYAAKAAGRNCMRTAPPAAAPGAHSAQT